MLKLFDQNVFPTLVLARGNGRAGTFNLLSDGSFHAANPMRLALIVFTPVAFSELLANRAQDFDSGTRMR